MSSYRRWQARYAWRNGSLDKKPIAVGSGFTNSKKVKARRKKDRKRQSLLARGILKLNPFNFGGKKRGDKKAKATGDR